MHFERLLAHQQGSSIWSHQFPTGAGRSSRTSSAEVVGSELPRDLWGGSGKESGTTTLENDADVTKDITKH